MLFFFFKYKFGRDFRLLRMFLLLFNLTVVEIPDNHQRVVRSAQHHQHHGGFGGQQFGGQQFGGGGFGQSPYYQQPSFGGSSSNAASQATSTTQNQGIGGPGFGGSASNAASA